MGVGLAQTITVVNRSGKVVKTSKHLTNLFNEAKTAYLDKRAELKSSRDEDLLRKATTKSGRRPSYDEDKSGSRHHSRRPSYNDDDSTSRHHSRRSSRDYDYDDRPKHRRSESERDGRESRRHSDRDHVGREKDSRNRERDSRDRERNSRQGHRNKRPSTDRGYSDSFYVNDHHTGHASTSPLTASNLRRSQTASFASSTSSLDRSELARRRSDSDGNGLSTIRASSRNYSNESVHAGLAYGELPPPLPQRHISEEDELRNKMSTLQMMLQEANCAQHSAKAVMKSLEDNPDAMAAVALTLAEISNLAAKMAPTALMALRGAFPMVIALLLSPEFLIAGGVALGVTVVSFGGYKIVKRMKRRKERKALEASTAASTLDDEEGDDELEEVEQLSQIDRIEQWRRGLTDAETAALSEPEPSVDGVFLTPEAGKQLRAEGILPPKASKKDKSRDKAFEKGAQKEKKEREKQAKTEAEVAKKSQAGTPKMLMIRAKVEDGAEIVLDTATSTLNKIFNKKDKTKGEVIA